VNRLCGSSMDAVATAARAIKSGELELVIAGGVESMSRAPFVVGKADAAFSRGMKIEDTTLGWRFVNPVFKAKYGTESMPETGEIVAEEYKISRVDQDKFALRSQQRAGEATKAGRLAEEIVAVNIPQKKGEAITVTAGNASGINDGACALLLASESAVKKFGLTPRARVIASAAAGVAPRVMGIGPIPASQKALAKANLKIEQMDVIELNEAFASQGLAVLRGLGMADDAAHVNPNGGAIAIGHPLGASGARLVTTATYQLQRSKGRYALCTMCIGVGQGISIILERV
jgi:acetyl-CoA acyltransferase